ncbi:hypothetical protein AVEN_125283-1 [Araneus ventricosus]|uniref:Uncharacterized protein n=1 Tax=Araneus ventricosus TaxID=182803 RepID=A0A4Y2JHG4_ARAVE|nr:hypothetical protein AVEN_125283-1 [Araneus ventricosus]
MNRLSRWPFNKSPIINFPIFCEKESIERANINYVRRRLLLFPMPLQNRRILRKWRAEKPLGSRQAHKLPNFGGHGCERASTEFGIIPSLEKASED